MGRLRLQKWDCGLLCIQDVLQVEVLGVTALCLENSLLETPRSNARVQEWLNSPTRQLRQLLKILIRGVPKTLFCRLWKAMICSRYEDNLTIPGYVCWEVSRLAKPIAVYNVVFHPLQLSA